MDGCDGPLFILVGLRGAGKTTALDTLASDYKVLKPSTTRGKRGPNDTEYDFTNVANWAQTQMAWEIDVNGDKYGMRMSEIAAIPANGALTVADPAPDNIKTVLDAAASRKVDLITIGLDTIENLEDQHIRIKGNQSRKMTAEQFVEQRRVVLNCDAVLTGDEIKIQKGIKTLIELYTSRGGILGKEFIEPLVDAGCLVRQANPRNFQPASYDLSLGDDVWVQGEFITLSDSQPVLKIPAYSYAIVSAHEKASLPNFVAGRFDLKVSLFFQGVVLSNGPQVDPGYKGALFCMLYNGSDSKVGIARGQHFATIEFCTTAKLTAGYKKEHQGKTTLREFMPSYAAAGQGGRLFETLQERIKSWEERLFFLLPIMLAAVAIVVPLFFSLYQFSESKIKDMASDSEKTLAKSLDENKKTLEKALDDSAKTIKADHEEIESLKSELRKTIDDLKKEYPKSTLSRKKS